MVVMAEISRGPQRYSPPLANVMLKGGGCQVVRGENSQTTLTTWLMVVRRAASAFEPPPPVSLSLRRQTTSFGFSLVEKRRER